MPGVQHCDFTHAAYLHGILVAQVMELVVLHDLRANEASLEVAVDGSCCLQRDVHMSGFAAALKA